MTFEVARKAQRHGSWETVGKRTDDPRSAMSRAQRVDGHEVGVFVYGPDGLGYLYWTSRHATVLNDTVVNEIISGCLGGENRN